MASAPIAIPTSGLIIPYEVLETMYSKSWLEESETEKMVIVTCVITALAVPTCVLRIISRMCTLGKLGIDDWLMSLSGLFSIVALVITVINGRLGCGRHTVMVEIQNLYKLLKVVYAEEIIYLTSLWNLKQSILFLYLRLSPARSWRNWIYGVSLLNSAVSISMILFNAFQCSPTAGAWNPFLSGRKCIETTFLLLFPPALNIFVDIIILLLPALIIGPLKVSTRRKFEIAAVLGVGLVSIVVSAVRMSAFADLAAVYSDSTYALATITYMSALELQVATIAANIPAIKSLYSFLVKKREGTAASYELSDERFSSKALSRNNITGGGRSRVQESRVQDYDDQGSDLSTESAQVVQAIGRSQEDLCRKVGPVENVFVVEKDDRKSTRSSGTGRMLPGQWRPENFHHETSVHTPEPSPRLVNSQSDMKIYVDTSFSVQDY